MHFQTVFVFLFLASSKQLKLIGAVPGTSGNLQPTSNDAMRMSKGTSYITAISILGSVVGLLFLVKWVYVSRRRNNQHKGSYDTSRFVWRDEFSASSLPLWGDDSSHSKKYVRSALLVGLFGSPSWETRYSAIVDKVSGNQSGQGSLLPIDSPRRYRSISADSEQNARMLSPNLKCRAESLHLADGHRLTTLFKTIELRPPSPAMGSDSGTNRSRYSENTTNSPDINEWRIEILSGQHTSYPSGLCIGRRSGLDPLKTKIPISFLPSIFSSTQDPLENSVPLTAGRETGPYNFPQYSKGAGTGAEIIHPAECCTLPKTVITEVAAWNIESDGPRNDLEGLLINGSSRGQKCASLDSSHDPEIPSAWDLNEPEKSASAHSGEISGASYIDYRCGADFSSITPIKPRIRMPPPRERVRSRSPKVGPSPLRRMFLPTDESTENANDSESILPSLISKQNDDGQRQWHHKYGDIDQLPVLSFNSFLDTKQAQATDLGYCSSRPAEESSKTQRSPIAKEKQSDGNLLDFLEELVQETSEWDADMFVDNNFKAMIDSSKSFDTCTPTAQRKKSTQSRRRRVSFIYLEGIPEADITEFSPPNVNEDDCSYWSDEDDIHRAVGIAR